MNFLKSIKINSQSGSASLFFAVFVIPVMVVVGTVVIDVEAYTQRRQILQIAVDDATMFGAKYLPNQALAKTATTNFLAQKVQFATSAVNTSNEQIEVQASENFIPFLASFFKNVSSATSLMSIPVVAHSMSRVSPLDLYIAVERGDNTAPQLTASDNERFGSPGEFPLPSYFSSNQFMFGGGPVEQTIALEQCFNPRLLAIKQMAARAIDLVRGLSMNRVALSFFPGSTNVVGQNARLTDVVNQKPFSLLDSHIEWDEDHHLWIEEMENGALFSVRSQDCFNVLQDTFSPDMYHIPLVSGFQDQGLTLSSIVWSRVASHSGNMDSAVMLGDLSQQLFSAGGDSQRGGLVNSTQQLALIFASHAPRAGGMMMQADGDTVWNALAAQLERIRSLKENIQNPLRLYYFIHNASPSSVVLLQSLFDQYRLTKGSREIFSATAVHADSLDKILTETLPFIIRGGQRAIIKE